MKAFKIGGIALLLVAATAYAVDGVVLKYVYKKDAVSKTRIKGSLEVQGTEVTVNMVNQSKVKEIADDGTVTLEDGLVEGKITFGGTEIPIDAQSASIMVLKPSGEIKEIRGDNVGENSYRLQNLSTFIPSTEGVKVGSKWNRTTEANKDTKAPAFKADYNIVAEEKIDGTDTFKIEYKHTETEGTDPATIEGTMWVSKEDCSLVKGSAKWTNVPSPGPGGGMPVSGSFTMERVK